MSGKSGRVLKVFLADDDEDDRILFADALSETGLQIKLEEIKDGNELMRKLLKEDAALPDIIFLDLNMPSKTGLECLAEIRSRKDLVDIVIIIYSTSANNKDIEETFYRGASLYIQKPIRFSDLKETLHKVFDLDWENHKPEAYDEKFAWIRARP